MDFRELKRTAEQKVKSRDLSDGCSVASVATALVTDKGNVYEGVCIDAVCGIGFCAEHAAIAQMITNEESRIQAIVSVGAEGEVFPPCGRCREFMFQVNHENLETDVLVDENTVVKLKDLLPYRYAK